MPFIHTGFPKPPRELSEGLFQPQRLRTCGKRFLLSEKLSKTGYFEFDAASKQMWFSQGLYEILEAKNTDRRTHFSLRRLIYKEDWPLYKKHLWRLLSGQKIEGYIRLMTFKNKLKNIKFAAAPQNDGCFPKIAGVFADISQEIAELEKHQRHLWAERAHDIRQPIQSMMLLAEELGTASPKDYPETARLLKNIGKYLNDSLCRIMEEDKNYSKHFVENKSLFNLGSLIRKIGQEYQAKANHKGLKLIDAPQDSFVTQDAFLLERIIRNLLENALKYAQSKIILKNKGNIIWIADDGRGIKKEDQKHIFQRFYQCLTPAEEKSGYGLGLNIVAQIAAEIGAVIKIKSKEGVGTIFKIRL